ATGGAAAHRVAVGLRSEHPCQPGNLDAGGDGPVRVVLGAVPDRRRGAPIGPRDRAGRRVGRLSRLGHLYPSARPWTDGHADPRGVDHAASATGRWLSSTARGRCTAWPTGAWTSSSSAAAVQGGGWPCTAVGW